MFVISQDQQTIILSQLYSPFKSAVSPGPVFVFVVVVVVVVFHREQSVSSAKLSSHLAGPLKLACLSSAQLTLLMMKRKKPPKPGPWSHPKSRVLGPVSKWSLRQDLLLKLRHVNDSSSRFLSLSSKSCLKLHLETGPWNICDI